jgi:hypothetical protein
MEAKRRLVTMKAVDFTAIHVGYVRSINGSTMMRLTSRAYLVTSEGVLHSRLADILSRVGHNFSLQSDEHKHTYSVTSGAKKTPQNALNICGDFICISDLRNNPIPSLSFSSEHAKEFGAYRKKMSKE